MEFWTELGIEKTKDTEAITAAYHEKLKSVNPEDKPEEFMRLRAQYEEALSYASAPDESEQSEAPKGPVDLWMDRVKAVYEDYSRRVDPDEWKRLFADEVCEGLDSRIDARNALLEYMMENYRLPREIFVLLDEQWDLIGSRSELYEIFPRDFIDYAIISNIREDTGTRYDLFEPASDGKLIDSYIALSIKAKNELQARDFDAADATLADMEKTGIYNPVYDLLRCRRAMYQENYGEAQAIADKLAADHPQVDEYHYMRGDVLRTQKQFTDALEEYEKALAMDEKYGGALYGKAECLAALGRLEEAKDVFYDLADIYVDDQSFMVRIEEINKKLLADYDQRAKTETFDFETGLKYAWCLYQTGRNEEAAAVAEALEPQTVIQRCDFENIICKLYLTMGRNEQALEHAEKWEKEIGSLEGDSREIRDQRRRLWRAIHIQALAQAALLRYDEALETAERSFETNPERTDALEARRRIFAVTHKLDKMVAEAERIVDVRPSFITYYTLGLSQYEISMKQDAFHSFGKAIEYDKNVAAYIQRARILCDYDQYDDAEEITNLLKENEIDDDNVKYIEARILEGRKHEDEALEIYRGIISRYEADQENNGTGIMWETYYYAALLEQDHKSTPELIEMCRKGLECKEDYLPLMSLLAFFLDKNGDKQEAIDQYREMTVINPRHGTAYTNMGNVYFDDLDDFAAAAECYEKQLEVNETARVHCFAGRCYRYLFEYDKAEEHFRRGLEIEPGSVMLRSDLAWLYEYKKDYQSSYDILKALADEDEKAEQRNPGILRSLSRVLARMGRRDEAIDARLRNYSLFEESDDAVKVIELCIEGGQADRAESFIKQFRSQGKINDEQYQYMMRDILLLRRQVKKLVTMLKGLPEDSIVRYSTLATIYRREGQFKKAVECYRKCDEIKGRDEVLGNCRLYCYKWMGDTETLKTETENIQRNVDRLKKCRWEYALYLTKMALIRTATDRPEEALPYIEEALSGPLCNSCKYPRCKDALVALAEYHCARKEYSKAIEVCKKGLEIAADEYDFVAIMELINKHHKKELKKEQKQ